MRRNDEIQAALVAKAKANLSITAEIPSTEIREVSWQGTEFSYPNLRIRILSNTPISKNCNAQEINTSWLVYSENDSSQEANRIAGIISQEFHDRQFTSNGIAFSLIVTNVIPAIRSDIRTWRSEVIMRGLTSG